MFWLLPDISLTGTTSKGCTLNLPCCHQEESREQGFMNFGLENEALSITLVSLLHLLLPLSWTTHTRQIFGACPPQPCAFLRQFGGCWSGQRRQSIAKGAVAAELSPLWWSPASLLDRALGSLCSFLDHHLSTALGKLSRDHQSNDHDNQTTLTQLHQCDIQPSSPSSVSPKDKLTHRAAPFLLVQAMQKYSETPFEAALGSSSHQVLTHRSKPCKPGCSEGSDVNAIPQSRCTD